MFNLNESDRIVMAQQPTDMRMGVNCLIGQVRYVGLDPANGDVYIFVSKSRKVMKILYWVRCKSMGAYRPLWFLPTAILPYSMLIYPDIVI